MKLPLPCITRAASAKVSGRFIRLEIKNRDKFPVDDHRRPRWIKKLPHPFRREKKFFSHHRKIVVRRKGEIVRFFATSLKYCHTGLLWIEEFEKLNRLCDSVIKNFRIFFHDILLQISIIHSFKKVVIFFKFTPFWKNGCRFLITKTNIFFTTNLDVTDVEKNISTDCFLINCVKISLISLYYLFKKLGMVSYFWRSSWKTLKFLEPNHLDDSVLKHSCIENIYIKSAAGKKRTISPFLRTTIFRWCEKIFFSRRKGCGNFFIHLGRRWSYPIFNFKTNDSSRNFCGGGSCYTW